MFFADSKFIKSRKNVTNCREGMPYLNPMATPPPHVKVMLWSD